MAVAVGDTSSVRLQTRFGDASAVISVEDRGTGIAPEDVTDELVSRYLYTAGVPDPDLIIRTSGELRVSNFLIWQAAYSEWYVTPTYWPDFDKEEYRRALETFAQRDRRYGKVSSNEYEASNA